MTQIHTSNIYYMSICIVYNKYSLFNCYGITFQGEYFRVSRLWGIFSLRSGDGIVGLVKRPWKEDVRQTIVDSWSYLCECTWLQVGLVM